MASNPTFTPTLMVWWRYGKEHGGDDFRLNPQDVVAAHVQRKVARFRQTPQAEWRWWRVDHDLIVERPPARERPFGEDTCIYYLLEKGVSVIENVYFPPPDDRWKWYIHISDFVFDDDLDTWLMKDLICDVMVAHDDRSYHIFNLPDMAQALDVGLITTDQTRQILGRIDWLVNLLAGGEFPLPEVSRGRQSARRMGW